MFKKNRVIIIPRCPVCGRLMCMDPTRASARIAVTYPAAKAKRVQDTKQEVRYASFEICALHLEHDYKGQLINYLHDQHAILGVDAPGLQPELS